MISPGIAMPEMMQGANAELSDDMKVIGIVMSSGPRAYVIASMSQMSTHVVNDLVDGIPLSVSYCDRTKCARVLTRDDSDEMIDLMVGGFREGAMLLRLDGIMYPQDSEDIPLIDMEYTCTDWRSWYADHPDTTVFVGQGVPQSSSLPEPSIPIERDSTVPLHSHESS